MRTKVVNNKVIPLSPEEEALRDAEEAEFLSTLALRKWVVSMEESDETLIPRCLEDHIKDDHGGVAANPDLQAKYDAKRALRAKRP